MTTFFEILGYVLPAAICILIANKRAKKGKSVKAPYIVGIVLYVLATIGSFAGHEVLNAVESIICVVVLAFLFILSKKKQ